MILQYKKDGIQEIRDATQKGREGNIQNDNRLKSG
jgi:hypothetical protein